MIEPLNSIWIGQLCSEIVKSRQELDAKQKNYDHSKYKYLSLKKYTKRECVKKAGDDLKKIKSETEDARYDIARKFSEVATIKIQKTFQVNLFFGKKKVGMKRGYDFLEMVTSFMECQISFYKDGNEQLQNLRPTIERNKDTVDIRKSETKKELVSFILKK